MALTSNMDQTNNLQLHTVKELVKATILILTTYPT